jgi:GNAT superfamily N-acetyltransferase
MSPDEIHMVEQVNRTEVVEAKYVTVASPDGMSLTLQRVEEDPPGRAGPWGAEGVATRIAYWKPKIEEGGVLLGAFRGQRLVGFSVLGGRMDDGSAELAGMFVDSDHRRQGIGSLLMTETERLARQKGIRALFIYANRTASAVEFYLKHGCTPITLRSRSIVQHWKQDPVFAKEL